MWQRLLILLVFFASLLPTSVHAQSDIAQIQLTNRYAANELVRVIVSLRSTYQRNAVTVSPAQLATRQRAITRQVSTFRERHRALFHTVHREFSVFPTIAVTVLRRDIERLAALPDVVRIDEDIARPSVLDESGELIHSRAVIEGGYGGAGSTVVVLDTGVKADHPFLDGQVIAEACFSSATDNGNWTSLCPGGTSY